VLSDASISGNLYIVGASSYGSIGLQRAQVGQDVLFGELTSTVPHADDLDTGPVAGRPTGELCEVSLFGARIGHTLWLTGAALQRLRLDEAVIGANLVVAERSGRATRWISGGELTLRNAHVGGFVDGDDARLASSAWPKKLALRGLTVARLGGLDEGQGGFDGRDAAWLIDWLARDRVFSRQPYLQMARLFRDAGDTTRANTILRAAREREQALEWERRNYLQWASLFALQITIGYGIGLGYFLIFAWLIAVNFLGAFFLHYFTWLENQKFWNCFWYSLDRLLPIINFSGEAQEMFKKARDWGTDSQRTWLGVTLAMLAVCGYVFALPVGLGLAGLTQGD
jgi:hypothetical protein